MRTAFRNAVAKHLGHTLTPEVAVAIELEAFGNVDLSHDPAKFGQAKCGSVTFQVERFEDVLPDLHLMHSLHWLETEKHRHGLRMNPDYDAMASAERAGQMVQFTARAEGRLVGNIRMYLRQSRHTRTQYGQEDTLFLAPDQRRGRNAIRFIEFVHDSMRAIGVREIRADAKLVNGTDRLLKHLGYQPVATTFVKFLED